MLISMKYETRRCPDLSRNEKWVRFNLCCRNSVTFSLYDIINSIVCLDPTGSSNVNDHHCAADNRFNNIHFRSSGAMV